MKETKKIKLTRADYKIVWILGALSGLMPFATDLYLPAFGSMSEELGVEYGMIVLTMGSFLAGTCVGMLINGPLLDKFGRKIPIILGLLLFALCSVGCALAQSIEVLIVLRFLQALGISVCVVGSRTIVRDLFPPRQIAYVFSTIALVMGVAPIIGPSVGSVILLSFDWRGIFYTLAILSTLLAGIVYFFLPESKADTGEYSLHPKAILKKYKQVWQTPTFVPYALIGGLGTGSLMVWISNSSLLFMENFQLTSTQYGWVFASTAFCLIVGNQMNRMLLQRFDSPTIAYGAVCCQVVVAFLLLGAILYYFELWFVLGLLYLFMLTLALIRPNAYALSLLPFKENIGIANAILGTFSAGSAALAVSALGWLADGTPMPMVLGICVISLLSLMVQYAVKRSYSKLKIEKA